MKRFLLILVLIAGSLAVNAQTFTVNDLLYSVNEDGISVTVTGHVEGTAATGSIIIPNTVYYNGRNYPVTIIGEYAFRYSHRLHGTLTIGNNVTDIERGAFQRCDSLSGNLNIPNSVINIGAAAFSDCDGFTGSLTIPNSVVTIGNCAFDQCNGFNGTLTISSSVESIGASAFSICDGFTEIVSLATEPPVLGTYVFFQFGCSSLIVPCGSKNKYENSAWYGGNAFTTIIEDCEDVSEIDDTEVSANIHPNPATDFITIDLPNEADCQSVEIYDIDGRLVVETFPETSHPTTIDISGLNAGMYIMKIMMADGKEFSEKIVKE